ncbi:hypothetical protein BLNAU_23688 [Blattamonas nauphoetae]|uniref:Uncharacterized protein n=1 Tax=Blattamonas nauphoetae TaxID=2049346 RepID=A0ABQ9WPK8_9EUKA|nr:hypothetical protein BLNAU_23688 [Blattamonas nauphoetae]
MEDGRSRSCPIWKLMLQALISEGYEDTLEQKLLNNKNGHFGPIASLKLLHIHFCGLSSDAGNALIAGADEQILQSPPIVQKRSALLGSSFSTRLSLTVTPINHSLSNQLLAFPNDAL